MAIVVEDGTGIVGANSYVTEAEADEYFANHPFYADAWDEIENKEALLRAATSQIDFLFNWYGWRSYEEQVLAWPRQRVWYLPSYAYIPTDSIPQQVKDATCEMAYFLSKGDVFAPSSSEGLDSLKIDVIELNFTNSSSKSPVPAAVLVLLRSLGDYAFGGRSRKVLVG